MSQLRVLEFGLIFDGASQHHDVPRALEAVGDLQQLQVRGMMRNSSSMQGPLHMYCTAEGLHAVLCRNERGVTLSNGISIVCTCNLTRRSHVTEQGAAFNGSAGSASLQCGC
jgi:hypothetical protein